MVTEQGYKVSDLDGEQAGGFVVLNVGGRYQICDDDGSGYFATLADARAACLRLRRESGNSEIYVYAVVGVRDGVEHHASDLALA